jgi:lactose/L-arabinose transport system ATP-binding protein
MNFLEGEVTGKDGGVTVKLLKQGDTSITLPIAGDTVAVGDTCQLGIRPEHLSRTEGTMLTLNVDVAEHLGGESYLYAASAQGESLTIETRAGRDASHGSAFEIGIPADSAFLFDADEKRVR